jgi:predicted secreted Zn-dependent protease
MMAKVLAKLEKAQNDFDKVEGINFERRLIRLLIYRLQRIEAYEKAKGN